MERFERRTQQIESSLQAAHQQLQQLAQQVPVAVQQAAHTEMQKLRGSIASAVDAGVGQTISSYEDRLRTSGQHVQQASHTFAAQIHGMQQLGRHLLWKVVGVCLASLVLLVLGGGWLSTVVSSILVVVQPASRASRPAKASLRKSVPAIICCCPLQSTACYSSVGSSTGLDLPAWSAMCGSTWTYVPIGQR